LLTTDATVVIDIPLLALFSRVSLVWSPKRLKKEKKCQKIDLNLLKILKKPYKIKKGVLSSFRLLFGTPVVGISVQ